MEIISSSAYLALILSNKAPNTDRLYILKVNGHQVESLLLEVPHLQNGCIFRLMYTSQQTLLGLSSLSPTIASFYLICVISTYIAYLP